MQCHEQERNCTRRCFVQSKSVSKGLWQARQGYVYSMRCNQIWQTNWTHAFDWGRSVGDRAFFRSLLCGIEAIASQSIRGPAALIWRPGHMYGAFHQHNQLQRPAIVLFNGWVSCVNLWKYASFVAHKQWRGRKEITRVYRNKLFGDFTHNYEKLLLEQMFESYYTVSDSRNEMIFWFSMTQHCEEWASK